MNTLMARLAVAALAAGSLCARPAAAQTGFQLAGPSSGNSVTVRPGQSFTFSVFLTADQPVTGVTYFLDAADPGAGQFQITGRGLGDSPFTDLTTDTAVVLQTDDALLQPQNTDDLGGTLADVGAPLGAGTYRLSDLTLQALSSITPGVYTIQTSPNSSAFGADFGDLTTGAGTFTVNVSLNAPVPESSPTVSLGLLLALGLGSLVAARRRKV